MARTSLATLLLLLAGMSLLPGDSGSQRPAQDLSIAADLLAPFSAESAKVEGDTLVLRDLRDVPRGTRGRQLAGRALLKGDRHALLGLWALKVGSEMARATPLLGHEGPGQTFPQPVRAGGSPTPNYVPFRTPVRLTLIPLDAKGGLRSGRQVTVRALRLAGMRH